MTLPKTGPMNGAYHCRGGWLIDAQGRHALLRGVNVGANCKLPTDPNSGQGLDPPLRSAVSFVGRPFPLSEADGHFARIAAWGFNVVRLLFTWEAVEHDGPGVYDEAYLDSLRGLAQAAGGHGLQVFFDPHQDLWSRWTGGDGAPLWTLPLAGLRPERLVPAQAVTLHSHDWLANYARVPVAALWTLFFGGATFLPDLSGPGSGAAVQEMLQSRFIAAAVQVARRVADLDNVIGYDTLNEPSPGYIGRTATDLGAPFGLSLPPPFTALQHLHAADGATVRHADGRVLNPAGLSIWQDGCPLRRAGLWDADASGAPVLLQPDHFTHAAGRPVNVFADFMAPFLRRLRAALRAVHPGCLLFIEGSPLDFITPWDDPDPQVVNGRHFYDAPTITSRAFRSDAYDAFFSTLSGVPAIAAHLADQLRGVQMASQAQMGGLPVLLGEFGVPYDLNGRELYTRGDARAVCDALEVNYRAIEATLVSATQWSYNPDHSPDRGDDWNHEDFSLYSADSASADGGERGSDVFCRPYVRRAAGRPLSMAFHRAAPSFDLTLDADPAVTAPTEIFVPSRHFPPANLHIEVSVGQTQHLPEQQLLRWSHPGASGPITLRLRHA